MLADKYDHVREQIMSACRASERAPDSVRLLAVSKTRSADEIRQLYACGPNAFGENYLQEALDKIEALQDLPLEWHFIGPIQSNKTRPIAEHFDWVHSVDRLKIAKRLSEQRPAHRAPLNICLQVNISEEASKSGCAPDELPALARAVAALPNLQLRGLMAIPEAEPDPERQRATFARVRTLLTALQAELPRLDTLSMGMSGDLDAAIAEGATIVRIGTALFGPRPSPNSTSHSPA
ncbi:YggS family pyridoxal phosphate-dependent enzyme [Marinobacterium weihaiense]|uniref:Pyridoxal phosphate homeostasis protein n=1 Tax=Marinobacterium weihaiense TaxID=2851016 RepID=A0ABS6MAH3_9GAMM|nr:YggS family pyridoxal phosphate-dependent enzyme [Marinobacterium weihaiense]MBV0933288.1 YggS family pyridoxal phosphate-dependent enzyme [Marinobacterium weihaiense]